MAALKLAEVQNFVEQQAFPGAFCPANCCQSDLVLGVLLKQLDGLLLEVHCVVFEEGNSQDLALSKAIALQVDQIFQLILVQQPEVQLR